MPGFPFSPQRPRLDERTHELWHRLMTQELGIARYVAHGGDLGAGVSSRPAESHPEAVAGLHLLAVASPQRWDEASLTAEEREHIGEQRRWFEDEGAYAHQQQTRPLTLASLYWFSDSISTSLRPYWEYATGRTTRVGRVRVPTAVAVFPADLTHPPCSWAERSHDVVRCTRMPRGGHFAPHEEPDLLAADIRALLRPVGRATRLR